MGNKKSFHVSEIHRARRSSTTFCTEPQALVNVCLSCPFPKCKPTGCKRYENAKIRLHFGVFPLVDDGIPVYTKPKHKCQECVFGKDCGGKVFCPLIRGTCMKEE